MEDLTLIKSSNKPPLETSITGIRMKVKSKPLITAAKQIVIASKITEKKMTLSL